MHRQESAISLTDWIEEETRHIDVVASWESLYDTYESLRFTDQLSDAERLEEFKWIVQQMNSFLTKIKTKLMSCKNLEAMLEMLGNTIIPAGKMDLSTRRALVYQKLRQRWMKTMINQISSMIEQQTMMEMEAQDGWQD